MQQITKEQLTTLEDVAKKASIAASESLSKIIGLPVKLEITRARTVEIDKLIELVADPEEISMGVILPVTGNFAGSSILVSTLQESCRLAEFLLKRPEKSISQIDELAASALKEAANIIGGAFLSLLSNTTGFSLIQAVPRKMSGTMKEIVDMAIKELHHANGELTVAFEIDFSLSATTTTTTTTKIITHYVFFLDVEFAQTLLQALEK